MADPDGVGPITTQNKRIFSSAAHRSHGFTFGKVAATPASPAVIADDKCSVCHESGGAKYSRGAMATATQTCVDCHGGMMAVGGLSNLAGTAPARRRIPYQDQPRCESCHIGDLLTVATGPTVLRQAYLATDRTAAPRLAPTSRYAQEVGKSYADSLGHGKISCIGCHGSSHAEWPVTDATSNDNVAPMHVQGHRGVLTECKACHVGGVDVSLQTGPHGLHAINDPGWVAQHAVVYTANPKACTACHGLTLDGDYLARAATDRSFIAKDGTTVTYKKGDKVACVECHAKPKL
jgi:predicted CXXCH cytochrome family protein